MIKKGNKTFIKYIYTEVLYMKKVLFYFALILNIIFVIYSIIPKDNTEYISVKIKGYVGKPNVYLLKEGSTVNDLILEAGNLKEEADISITNRAKELKNGDVVIIYSKDEIKGMREGSTSIKYVDKECICPRITNNSCLENVITNKEELLKRGRVSLNSATIEELMTLPGIGESKAKLIIEYRDKNNGFKSINEITNVKGIGPSIYEKIKAYLIL